MSAPVTWLPAHDAALKHHIEVEHLSALQASVELNRSFRTAYSRNAVIGRAKRTGIRLAGGRGGRRGPKGGPSQKRPRAKAVTPTQRPDVALRKAASGPKLGPVSFQPRPDPRPGQVPLLELAADGCKWPSGEGAAVLFCNEPQLNGHPYCADHCCLAYRQPEPRRQRQ